VFKAHKLLYHSTLGLRVIKKKRVGDFVPEPTTFPGFSLFLAIEIIENSAAQVWHEARFVHLRF